MNWLKQGGARVLFHQIFSLLWRTGWLVGNYFANTISRGAESSICWSFLLCQQLTQMNLANRMLSRDGFALNPPVQRTAAPAAQRPEEGVRSGTQLCSSAGWVQRHVDYSKQATVRSNPNKPFRPVLQRRWMALTGVASVQADIYAFHFATSLRCCSQASCFC